MAEKAGKSFGFMNCRKPKEEVSFIAKDVKDFFAESVPLLDTLKLQVGLFASLKDRPVEAREELLRTVSEAGRKGHLALGLQDLHVVEAGFATAHDHGDLYVIEASLPEATNKATAQELAAIMNQMYNSPLFDEGEPFKGIIAYYENGKYILRD